MFTFNKYIYIYTQHWLYIIINLKLDRLYYQKFWNCLKNVSILQQYEENLLANSTYHFFPKTTAILVVYYKYVYCSNKKQNFGEKFGEYFWVSKTESLTVC